MNQNRKSLLIVFFCGAVTLSLLGLLSKELRDNYVNRLALEALTQKNNTYQENPIMKQPFVTQNRNYSTDQLLSAIKTCVEKNQMSIINSELKTENNSQGLTCQLQGEYLAFLAFLNSYNQQLLPYEISQFSISKNPETVTIEIAFVRETIATKNHVI